MKGRAPFIESNPRGLFIRARVQPRSSGNEVAGVHADALKIKVTAPPADGEANRAVIELLSKTLRIPKSSLSIVSGESSRTKLIKVHGVEPDELEARFAAPPPPKKG